MALAACLPTEIIIAIFLDVFGDIGPGDDFSDSLASQRHLRLLTFRKLATVCRSWTDPARTVYWTVLDIPVYSNLTALAQVMNAGPSLICKSPCIREIIIAVPFLLLSKVPIAALSREAERIKSAMPAILSHLPRFIDVFRISCPKNKLGRAMFEAIESFGTWFVDVRCLAITQRPDGRPISQFVHHFCHVENLELSVSSLDEPDEIFVSAFDGMRLHSLRIRIDFARSYIYEPEPPAECIPSIATRLIASLTPACRDIRHMSLNLANWHDAPKKVCVLDTFNIIHKLGAATLTHLDISLTCAKGVCKDYGIVHNVIFSSVFPNLLHLRLHEFGVSIDAFQQMQCSRLQTLLLVLPGSEIWGEKTVSNILDICQLPPLSNLKELDIFFGEIPYDDSIWVPESMCNDLEKIWDAVKTACGLLGIDCRVHSGLFSTNGWKELMNLDEQSWNF